MMIPPPSFTLSLSHHPTHTEKYNLPCSKEHRIKGKEILEKIGLENLPAGVTEIRVMEDSDFIALPMH